MHMKTIVVDFMYLDLNTCERCVATDDNLDCALSILSDALRAMGYTVKRNKIEIKTKELAVKHRFLSSPTIRVNGVDICGEIKENWCKDCVSLSDGRDVDCRVFSYNGKEVDQPPVPMIIDGILKVLYGNLSASEDEYKLPDNLEKFFKNKCSGPDDITLIKRCC